MHNLRREGAWLGPPSRFKFETSCKRHAPILPAGAVFFSTVSERSSGPCEPFQHGFATLPVRRYHGSGVSRRVHFPLSIFGKMGLRPGMGAQLRPVARHITVSKEYKGKNVLYDALILVHRQVAHFAVELDRDRAAGLQIVAGCIAR